MAKVSNTPTNFDLPFMVRRMKQQMILLRLSRLLALYSF